MMDGKNLGEDVEKMVNKFVGNCFGELGHGGAELDCSGDMLGMMLKTFQPS